jgi:hypothetical protein
VGVKATLPHKAFNRKERFPKERKEDEENADCETSDGAPRLAVFAIFAAPLRELCGYELLEM